MADISELDQRIQAALERISNGLEGLGQAAADAALAEEIEAERMANAQLEERIRALREQHEAQLRETEASASERVAAIESEMGQLRATHENQLQEVQTQANERLAALEEDLGQSRAAAEEAKSQNRALRQSNQRLNASLASLREAGVAGVEPHLLNHAMMSELEALRTLRTSDKAEMEEILGALRPLLKEGAHA